MALAFRNLTIDPSAPVEDWGFEGLLAAVDRGDLTDWRQVLAGVRKSPWGEVAALLQEVRDCAEDVGAASAVWAGVELIRQREAQREREQVAAELRQLVDATGRSSAEFARLTGTSPSRFSTYVNGQVVPSAAYMVRARRLVSRG